MMALEKLSDFVNPMDFVLRFDMDCVTDFVARDRERVSVGSLLSEGDVVAAIVNDTLGECEKDMEASLEGLSLSVGLKLFDCVFSREKEGVPPDTDSVAWLECVSV